MNNDDAPYLSSANGQPLTVLGSADLSVNINGLVFCQTFKIVDNLNFSVLLRYDFLTANKAEISIVDQTLSLMHGQLLYLWYKRILQPFSFYKLTN